MSCAGKDQIAAFFTNLNKELGDHCFVSGTYIFEGEEVFKFLKSCGIARLGQDESNWFTLSPKSHNLHIDNDKFQEHKLNNSVSSIKSHSAQYEVNLEDTHAIEYPCDLKCTLDVDTLKVNEAIQTINEDEDKEYDPFENFEQVFPEFQDFNYNNLNVEIIKKFENYCALNYKKTKSVLFYSFTVNINDQPKSYTFVKLERHPTTNIRDAIDHGFSAFKHYFTKGGEKRPNTWPVRREDLLVVNVKKPENDIPQYMGGYKPSKVVKCSKPQKGWLRVNHCTELVVDNKNIDLITTFRTTKHNGLLKSINRFLKDENKVKYYVPFNEPLKIKDPLNQGQIITVDPAYSFQKEDTEFYTKHKIDMTAAVNEYNDYVRTRNEMFIPLDFYKSVQNVLDNFTAQPVPSVGGKKPAYVKTDKKFPYNNREYTVYRYKSTRQEFILLKRERVLCSTLKRQKKGGKK